jgi:hypothetical protein
MMISVIATLKLIRAIPYLLATYHVKYPTHEAVTSYNNKIACLLDKHIDSPTLV